MAVSHIARYLCSSRASCYCYCDGIYRVSLSSLCMTLGICAWRWHLRRFWTQHVQNGGENNHMPLLHGCERDTCVNGPETQQPVSSLSTVGRADDSWYEVATCIARLGVVILYFYVCDRSVTMTTENKSAQSNLGRGPRHGAVTHVRPKGPFDYNGVPQKYPSP